jgi:hypothetical protein
MAAMAQQVEADGASPWARPETLRAWQEGDAGDPDMPASDG